MKLLKKHDLFTIQELEDLGYYVVSPNEKKRIKKLMNFAIFGIASLSFAMSAIYVLIGAGLYLFLLLSMIFLIITLISMR